MRQILLSDCPKTQRDFFFYFSGQAESRLTLVVQHLLEVPNVGQTRMADLLVDAIGTLVHVFTNKGEVDKAVQARQILQQMLGPQTPEK